MQSKKTLIIGFFFLLGPVLGLLGGCWVYTRAPLKATLTVMMSSGTVMAYSEKEGLGPYLFVPLEELAEIIRAIKLPASKGRIDSLALMHRARLIGITISAPSQEAATSLSQELSVQIQKIVGVKAGLYWNQLLLNKEALEELLRRDQKEPLLSEKERYNFKIRLQLITQSLKHKQYNPPELVVATDYGVGLSPSSFPRTIDLALVLGLLASYFGLFYYLNIKSIRNAGNFT